MVHTIHSVTARHSPPNPRCDGYIHLVETCNDLPRCPAGADDGTSVVAV
jgi:hypothetical protein